MNIYSRPRDDSSNEDSDDSKHIPSLIETTTNQMSHRQIEILDLLHIKPAIFEQPIDLTCTRSEEDDTITSNYPALTRLCAALRYFDFVQTSEWSEETKRALFVEFNTEIYQWIVDDTAHLVREHPEDVQKIHREWLEHYGLAKCTVTHCEQTTRHYQRGTMNRGLAATLTDDNDSKYRFLQSLYDKVHFYVFHLYEVGLRVAADDLAVDEKSYVLRLWPYPLCTHSLSVTVCLDSESNDEEESSGVAVDRWLAAKRDHVKTRRQKSGLCQSPRFDPKHSKYNIQSVHTPTDGATTFLDVFHRKYQSVSVFLEQNRYDSDAIELDLKEPTESNIVALVQKEDGLESMLRLIETIKCTVCSVFLLLVINLRP